MIAPRSRDRQRDCLAGFALRPGDGPPASSPVAHSASRIAAAASRRGLAESLKGHTLVESIATEHPDRGGAVITIAEVRA